MATQERRRSRWYWPTPDSSKIEVFAGLLKEAFSDASVTNGPDLHQDCWFYRVETGPDRRHHRVIVMREFFENNDRGAIQKKFRDWRLAKGISERACVLITEHGPDSDLVEAK